jgi:peptidoglycan/LPS O-acetylase OafA/YrhL
VQADTPCGRKPTYFPGLDVVRGVAILMVLLDHGLASDPGIYQAYGSRLMSALWYALRLGHMGVHLFFILSGVLITGVLLDTRNDRDYFRNFYARRALRILPAYSLMLIVLLATHNITARYLAVCLLFLCNMSSLFGVTNQYPALWSLAVEEQFYLFWPLTVRRLSTRSLTILCIAIVALTPLLRFTLLHGPHLVQDIRFKTWAVTDFFAAGALIAIAARSPQSRPFLQKAVPLLLLVAAPLFAVQRLAKPAVTILTSAEHAMYLEPWLLALSAFVLYALLQPAIARSVFARPLIFLAKISYGLYLVHPFLFDLINRHWQLDTPTGRGLFPPLLFRFLVETAASIAVAMLSRFTLERYFLRLKPRHQAA